MPTLLDFYHIFCLVPLVNIFSRTYWIFSADSWKTRIIDAFNCPWGSRRGVRDSMCKKQWRSCVKKGRKTSQGSFDTSRDESLILSEGLNLQTSMKWIFHSTDLGSNRFHLSILGEMQKAWQITWKHHSNNAMVMETSGPFVKRFLHSQMSKNGWNSSSFFRTLSRKMIILYNKKLCAGLNCRVSKHFGSTLDNWVIQNLIEWEFPLGMIIELPFHSFQVDG